MSTFKFSIAGIDQWAEKSTVRSLGVARRATRILGSRVIEDAPVDTGFMLSTARVRLNPSRTLSGRDRPKGFRRLDEAEVRESKMTELRAATHAMKLKDSVGLSFIASYTKYVHEGTSKQPAQPFISRWLSSYWPSIVKRAIAGEDA